MVIVGAAKRTLWTSVLVVRRCPPIPPTPSKTVRVFVKGRVQGVFYRNWTVDNAQQLGLNGWVRNKRDGSVEALFLGNPESITEMERRCCLGPPDAMVTGFPGFPFLRGPRSRV